jgi:uncharacterized protein
VFLSGKDVNRLCKDRGLDKDEFKKRFCRVVDLQGIKRLSLIEKDNFDCIFWEHGGCSVYESRPLQCRSYPFWSAHLYSADAWNSLEESCPGVNHGELRSQQYIEKWLKLRIKEPFLDL